MLISWIKINNNIFLSINIKKKAIGIACGREFVVDVEIRDVGDIVDGEVVIEETGKDICD